MRLKRYAYHLWESPTFTTWASLSINLAGTALLLPYVLRVFTPEETAFYLLILTINALQSLMTMGFTPTFSRFFAYSRAGLTLERIAELRNQPVNQSSVTAEINWQSVAAIVLTGKRLFALLALLSLILLLSGGSFALHGVISDLPVPLSGWIAWLMVCITMSVSIRSTQYVAYLQGMGHLEKSARCGAMMGLGGLVTCFLVLFFHGGLLALILARQVWLLAESFGYSRMARHVEAGKWNSFQGQMQPKVLKIAWQSAWRSALGVLGTSGLNSGLAIFYSTVTSSVKLASFLLAFRLINVVANISLAPFYSHLPELQKSYSAQAGLKFVQRAAFRMAFALWTFALPVSLLYIFGNHALDWIDAQTGFPSVATVIALALAFFAERYTGMAIQLYTITNHVIWHWFALSYIIAVSAIIYPLFLNFGALGIALTFLLARCLSSVPFSVILLKRMLKDHFWALHKPLAWPCLFMVVSSSIYWYVN